MDGGGGDSLGLDEDVCVRGIQHKFADELLRDGDGRLVGHAQIREIIQESVRCWEGAGGRREEFKNASTHKFPLCECDGLSKNLVYKVLQ